MTRTENNILSADVESPVTPKQLSEISGVIGRVQFRAALCERDHKKLAAKLRRFPKVALRAFDLSLTPEDNLDFLKHYKGLKRLSVDLYGLQSLEGLEHVADSLEYFELSKTKKVFSLDFLAKFKRLKGLYLEDHVNGIEAISTLKGLEELTLRSITLPNLEILTTLPKLWSLDIKLGGTKDLTALSRMKSLKYLELWLIKKLSDISPISNVITLQSLFLESLQNVQTIPSLKKLTKLRRIQLMNMKGIKDLIPLLEAKSLEDVIITRAAHLAPESFLPLQKHSSLKAIGFGLGSNKKNQAVAALFPQLRDTISYPFVYV